MGGPATFMLYSPIENMPYQYGQHSSINQQLPFLATLDLPNLSRLTNDPIMCQPFWPPIPHKKNSNIQKFDGNPGEDPNNHVITYHLWCSSNSLIDYCIHL